MRMLSGQYLQMDRRIMLTLKPLEMLWCTDLKRNDYNSHPSILKCRSNNLHFDVHGQAYCVVCHHITTASLQEKRDKLFGRVWKYWNIFLLCVLSNDVSSIWHTLYPSFLCSFERYFHHNIDPNMELKYNFKLFMTSTNIF